MKKRYNKVSEDETKRPKYTDGEGLTLSATGWKDWANERGYKSENSMTNKQGKFIIYNPLNNKTIKVLKRSE